MIPIRRNKLIGPFGEAQKNIEELASNMFLSLMILETTDKIEKLNSEYEAAVKDNDEGLISRSKMELEACYASLRLAAYVFDEYDAGENYND